MASKKRATSKAAITTPSTEAARPPLTPEALKKMKLRDLWITFTALGLGVTRDNNRGWLIEKILGTQTTLAITLVEDAPITTADEPPLADAPTESDALHTQAKALGLIPARTESNASLRKRIAKAQAQAPATKPDDAPAAEPTTKPKRAAKAKATPRPVADADAPTDAPEGTDASAAPKLSKMTTEELTALYTETIGRPTGSTNRGYLIWKIREARKGNIPVGPTTRATTKRDPDVKMMVLPLGMAEPDVDALDAAWKRLGHKSRVGFLRFAIGQALATGGEPEVAQRFV